MPDIKNLFDGVDWNAIKPQEYFNSEIPALRGDYKGVIKRFNFVDSETGGFYSLSAQITESVKGINGNNRYVDRTFNIGDTEYATEAENKERLLVALKTIGVTKPEDAEGKTICMKIRPNKDKRDKNGWPKHVVTIVKEFKSPIEGVAMQEAGTSKVPF